MKTRLARNQEALETFERVTALPMLILSLAVVPLLIVPLVVNLSPAVGGTFVVLDWAVWAVFAIEYSVRLFLAPRKRAFLRHNIIDLGIVVLPFLRPVRVIRSARALRLLRSGRAVTFMARSGRTSRDIFTRHKLHYALVVGATLVLGAALLVHELERGAPGAKIHSFADSLWWASATVTTVGFGDMYPVTEAGRAIAVVLMAFGIGLFGLIAASFASFFLGQRHDEQVEPNDIAQRLDRIERALLSVSPNEKPAATLEDRLAAIEDALRGGALSQV